MALADDILALRDSTNMALADAHDYYVHVRYNWNLLIKDVAAGRTFVDQNDLTGNVFDQNALLAKIPNYIQRDLTESTFIRFLTIFEGWMVGLLRIWLTAYPQSLYKRQIDFRTAYEAPDREAIVEAVVLKELNEVAYDKPAGWFAYLKERIGLTRPTDEEVAEFVEAKASRDLLVHGDGVVNKIYLAKAGKFARYPLGRRVEFPDSYHRRVWAVLQAIINGCCDEAAEKA